MINTLGGERSPGEREVSFTLERGCIVLFMVVSWLGLRLNTKVGRVVGKRHAFPGQREWGRENT